jgi:hypothetical protein
MPDQVLMEQPVVDTVESSVSAVSWPAILAGGLTAIAATLILLMVGAGLGFSTISPWPDRGASAPTLAIAAVIWLIVVQWIASGLGGYVAGRLRADWVGVARDETFFRDTAHGLLTWALATLVGVALLGSTVSAVMGAGVRGVGAVAGGAVSAAASAAGPVSPYELDRLLRPSQPRLANAGVGEVGAEVVRIIGQGLSTAEVPEADRAYLAQIVAARAGVPAEEARGRVDDVIQRARQAATQAREVAETARKTAARTSLFGALALLIGAFVASAAAGLGGRLRDHPSHGRD